MGTRTVQTREIYLTRCILRLHKIGEKRWCAQNSALVRVTRETNSHNVDVRATCTNGGGVIVLSVSIFAFFSSGLDFGIKRTKRTQIKIKYFT